MKLPRDMTSDKLPAYLEGLTDDELVAHVLDRASERGLCDWFATAAAELAHRVARGSV